MQSLYDYIVKPLGERYNNTTKVGDSELILNTEIFNHQFVNREAEVVQVPKVHNLPVESGDKIILHHNVFRRWHNVRGDEKNSRSYLEDGKYFIAQDQMFLYNKGSKWECIEGYCFIQPIESTNIFNENPEEPLMGIVKYSDGTVEEGSLVGFSPGDEYEFVIDGVRMYRVMSKFITIKYEYQGNEKEYNPSWADRC